MRALRIVFEDADLVVVDKPAGLLTIATATEKQRTLYALLYDRLHRKRPPEKVFVVHRLDRDVAGLVVFAKSPAAKEALQAQFREHSAGRVYTALVEGRVRDERFTLRSFLAENAAHRVYVTDDSRRGKLAVTHVRVLARRSDTTLLEIRLETGRKHQIRAHLADAGHPIVGDERYGSRRRSRPALHAIELHLRHPRTGAALSFSSRPAWDPPPHRSRGTAGG